MTRNIIFTIAAGFLVTLFVSVVGVRTLIGEYAIQTTRHTIETALAEGDYAVALGLLTDLEANMKTKDPKIEEDRVFATTLLIATANYEKAKVSAEQGEWFDVRALLRESDAVRNQNFIHYKDALTLLSFAEERIASLENSTAGKIAGLEEKTVKEKQHSRSLQSELEVTKEQKKQTANVLDTTKQLLEKSKQKVTETEAEVEHKKQLLLEEQQKVTALAAQAAREKLEKFLNEINVYVASLRDADGYITLALNEIRQKKDVSAILYVSQAKTLFDDVYGKAVGLRDRSDETKKEWAERIVSATTDFLVTTKNLRNAVIVIDEQEGDAFISYMKKAEEARVHANALVQEVEAFVTQNK